MHRMQGKAALKNMLLKYMLPARDRLINSAGCLVAKWVLPATFPAFKHYLLSPIFKSICATIFLKSSSLKPDTVTPSAL